MDKEIRRLYLAMLNQKICSWGKIAGDPLCWLVAGTVSIIFAANYKTAEKLILIDLVRLLVSFSAMSIVVVPFAFRKLALAINKIRSERADTKSSRLIAEVIAWQKEEILSAKKIVLIKISDILTEAQKERAEIARALLHLETKVKSASGSTANIFIERLECAKVLANNMDVRLKDLKAQQTRCEAETSGVLALIGQLEEVYADEYAQTVLEKAKKADLKILTESNAVEQSIVELAQKSAEAFEILKQIELEATSKATSRLLLGHNSDLGLDLPETKVNIGGK